jgi:hypothetical protein
VNLNYSTLTNIGKFNLMVDGNPVSSVDCEPASNGTCVLTWNTTFNPPGYHTAQVQLTLNGQLEAGASPDPTVLTGQGNMTQFTANNGMQFDPFYCFYDAAHGATLYAQLAEQDANYTIELQSPSGAHVKWLDGATSSGEISTNWNLTYDDDVTIYTNNSVRAVFNVTLFDPGSYGHNLMLHCWNGFDDGDFTAAYAWDDTSEATGDLKNCIQWTVVDQMIKLCNATFCYDHPYNSMFNTASDLTMSGGNAGYLSNDSDVARLIGNLSAESNIPANPPRNFYFFGHGSSVALGDDTRDQVHLVYTDIARALDNYTYLLHGTDLGWPYRFVFLDACATANDSDWAGAFGIPQNRQKSTQITAWPERAQAFVGWEGLQKVPGRGDLFDMNTAFIVFFGSWQSGRPINDCIVYSSKNYPPAPLNGFDLSAWKFGDYQHYSKSEQNHFGITQDPRLVLYGYAGITRTGAQPGYDQSRYYASQSK